MVPIISCMHTYMYRLPCVQPCTSCPLKLGKESHFSFSKTKLYPNFLATKILLALRVWAVLTVLSGYIWFSKNLQLSSEICRQYAEL